MPPLDDVESENRSRCKCARNAHRIAIERWPLEQRSEHERDQCLTAAGYLSWSRADDMKTIAITGASGVVGSRALEHLLAREEVTEVIALGRRALDVQHEKLVSKVVDLQSVDALAGAIPDGTSVAICSLGTTMKKAGSKAAFRAVDYDAVVAFAGAARRKDVQRFVLVSSAGANPHARFFYVKVKGEAEEAIERLGFEQFTVLRPSFLDDEGSRPETRAGERFVLGVSRALFSVIGRQSRYAPIRADVVGRAIARLALDATTERVRKLESDQLHSAGSRNDGD
jgi:uncharacterized protein YbjT (DUF2867 family)